MIVENKQIYQVKSINLSTATDRSKAKLCSIAKIRNQLNYKKRSHNSLQFVTEFKTIFSDIIAISLLYSLVKT